MKAALVLIQILGLAPVVSALKNQAKRRFFDNFNNFFSGFNSFSDNYCFNSEYNSRTQGGQCENNCCWGDACGTEGVSCRFMIRVRLLSLTRLCCRNVKWPSSSVSIAVSAADESFGLLLRKWLVNRLHNRGCYRSLHLRLVIVMRYPGCEC